MANKVSFKTKLGDLEWVFLQKGGRDNSVNRDGSKMQYSATLVVDTESPECKAMEAELKKIWNDIKQECGFKQIQPKSLGNKVLKDRETGEPIGRTAFIFKTNAKMPDGKDVEIKIYNARGEEVSLGDTMIGNGSKGIIHGEAALYEFQGSRGITLYLKAIQLVKLNKYSGGDVDAEDLTVQYPDAFGETFDPFIGVTPVAPINDVEL